MARKEFDLMKCVSKDTRYHFVTGIFHENGCKIATDGRVLACVPAVYPEEWENKIIDMKTFKEVKGQFPNYKRIYEGFANSKHLLKLDSSIFSGVAENLKLNDEFIKFVYSEHKSSSVFCISYEGKKINITYDKFKILLEFINSHNSNNFEVLACSSSEEFSYCNFMIKYAENNYCIVASSCCVAGEDKKTPFLMVAEKINFCFNKLESIENDQGIDGVLFNYLYTKKLLNAYIAFNKGILTKETIAANKKAQKILSSLMFVKDIEN